MRTIANPLVKIALAAGLVLAAIAITDSAPPAPGETITVRAGETLWGLAEAASPNEDPREWILKVQMLNHLTSTSLTPGQRLITPKD